MICPICKQEIKDEDSSIKAPRCSTCNREETFHERCAPEGSYRCEKCVTSAVGSLSQGPLTLGTPSLEVKGTCAAVEKPTDDEYCPSCRNSRHLMQVAATYNNFDEKLKQPKPTQSDFYTWLKSFNGRSSHNIVPQMIYRDHTSGILCDFFSLVCDNPAVKSCLLLEDTAIIDLVAPSSCDEFRANLELDLGKCSRSGADKLYGEGLILVKNLVLTELQITTAKLPCQDVLLSKETASSHMSCGHVTSMFQGVAGTTFTYGRQCNLCEEYQGSFTLIERYEVFLGGSVSAAFVSNQLVMECKELGDKGGARVFTYKRLKEKVLPELRSRCELSGCPTLLAIVKLWDVFSLYAAIRFLQACDRDTGTSPLSGELGTCREKPERWKVAEAEERFAQDEKRWKSEAASCSDAAVEVAADRVANTSVAQLLRDCGFVLTEELGKLAIKGMKVTLNGFPLNKTHLARKLAIEDFPEDVLTLTYDAGRRNGGVKTKQIPLKR